MVLDHEGEHSCRWATIMSVSAKIGCTPQTPDELTMKAEIYAGRKPGVTTDMVAKVKALEREVRELRQANGILRKASSYLPPFRQMKAFAGRRLVTIIPPSAPIAESGWRGRAWMSS